MRKKSLLYTGFGLALLLWALNWIALKFYFYWTLDWYDYLMHFLGGFTLGVIVIWALKIERRSFKFFLAAFLYVMVLGGVWEVFEYLNDIAGSPEEYKIDTIHDLMMDALGVVAAYYYTTTARLE